MAISFKEFNNKICLVDFEYHDYEPPQECDAIIFDWASLKNKIIKQYLDDRLGDEMFDYPGYKPFGVVMLPGVNLPNNLYDTNEEDIYEFMHDTLAFLMINHKNNKIFRGDWGEVDLKLEDLNIRLK